MKAGRAFRERGMRKTVSVSRTVPAEPLRKEGGAIVIESADVRTAGRTMITQRSPSYDLH